MIRSFLLMVALGTAGLAADATKVVPVWTITEGLQLPECACYDVTTKKLYVSNVATDAVAKDGKGFISTVGLNGKVENLKWVAGLNSPKGIHIFENILWVSCVDELVGIDIKKAAVVKRIAPKGAKFLNDVAVDSKGTVYVSDMLGNTIFSYDGKETKVFADGEDLEWPNGLLVDGDRILVGGWGKPSENFSTKVPGRLFSLDLKTKKKTLITEKPTGNLDGIELDGRGGLHRDGLDGGQSFSHRQGRHGEDDSRRIYGRG